MLSVDHAFFVKYYTCVILIGDLCSQERFSIHLIDRAAHRVWDFGQSKIEGRTQKYHVPAPTRCQASLGKILVPCYLNSRVGSMNIP